MAYEMFRGLLKSTSYAIKKDIKTFQEWEDGEITLNDCFKRFMSNNGYRKYKHTNDYNTPWYVDKNEFKRWLHSLGYVRLAKDMEVEE